MLLTQEQIAMSLCELANDDYTDYINSNINEIM